MTTPDVDPDLLKHLTPEELAELDRLLDDGQLWHPLPGPQLHGYESEADILGYGGAAGGGKTDLGIGLALTRHQRVAIFRQKGTELTAIVDRIADVLGTRDGYNGQDHIWRLKRKDGTPVQLELGSFPAPREETKYQGRPHDLIVFDEASNMRREAVRFLLGWLRTTDPRQRCRALLSFNPPGSVEGRWVIEFFAPWLDKRHPRPALAGELRWFATIDGADHEVGSEPFRHKGELITPKSRTFIPSRVADNPHLAGTGYMAQLQSLPEPLRSQLLYGDFAAGVEDDPWQVIPTEWVERAMGRWQLPGKLEPMDSMGVDVAMGGRDQTILARRHGSWFNAPIVYEGRDSKDGPTIAGWVIAALRDRAVIHIDLFGVGAQPYGHLMGARQQVVGVNVGEPAPGVDASGRLAFQNRRAELWWRMREALDPNRNPPLALPPDKRLLADLTAPCWRLQAQRIAVESREDIQKKLGRSPDYGSAYCLGLMDTPKAHLLAAVGNRRRDFDPMAIVKGRR